MSLNLYKDMNNMYTIENDDSYDYQSIVLISEQDMEDLINQFQRLKQGP